MRKKISILAAAITIATSQSANAQDYTSAYTKLNFDQHCTVLSKYELGVSAKCTGYTPPGMGTGCTMANLFRRRRFASNGSLWTCERGNRSMAKFRTI